MTSVKFRFLGSPSVEIDGVLTNRFRWSKLPAFFAYLILNPGEQTRETVAEALWPDRPLENARQNLRQTLLYADQLFSPATDQVLTVTRQTISLKRSAVNSDIDPFIGKPSPTLDRGGRARCLHLLDLYSGPLLAGMGEDWIVNARLQIARTYREALVFLAQDLLSTDANRSLSFAETAIAEDPFDDPARAAKIEALIALGRETAAQQEFAAYAGLLKDELGMQPGRIVSDALRGRPFDAPPSQLSPEPVYRTTEAVSEAIRFLRDQGQYKEAANLALALVPVWIGKGTPAYGQLVLAETFSELKRPVGVFEKLSIAKLSSAEGDTVKTREICEEILRAPRSTELPTEALAEAMLLLARVELSELKPVSALRYAIPCLRLLRRLRNRSLEFDAWNCVAIARFYSGQFARVLRPSHMAEWLSETLPDAAVRQEMRLFRAFALLRLDRTAEAQAIADGIWSESGGTSTNANYRYKTTLGRLFEDLGRRSEARAVYDHAVAECRSRGNMFALNVVLTYLGDMETELGHPDESLQHHFAALKSRRELKQNLGIATNLRGIGRALLAKGHANEARLCLQESAQRFRDDNALSGHASAQLLWAQAEFEAGDHRLAQRLAQNSVEILRGMSLPNRLTIGPWGARILEQGEDLLRRIENRLN